MVVPGVRKEGGKSRLALYNMSSSGDGSVCVMSNPEQLTSLTRLLTRRLSAIGSARGGRDLKGSWHKACTWLSLQNGRFTEWVLPSSFFMVGGAGEGWCVLFCFVFLTSTLTISFPFCL